MDATISILSVLPEEARLKVLDFARELVRIEQPANPHRPLSSARILSDLEESRAQIARGEGLDLEEALDDLGRRHGFL